MTVFLEQNAEIYDPVLLGGLPSNVTLITVEDHNATTLLWYGAFSNEHVDVYRHPDNAITCDLSIIGTRTCTVSYELQARSVNGTVAIQHSGDITYSSECLDIKTRYDLAAPAWTFDPASVAGFAAGYEVREDPLVLEMPYVQPVLTSGDNITARCGPLVYDIQITSDRPGPYPNEVLKLTPTVDGTLASSASLTVYTTDQNYALYSGVAPPYRELYQFSLSAKFTYYSGTDGYEFVYDQNVGQNVGQFVDLYIRDYCAGMYLSDPPEITKAQVYSQDPDYIDTFNVSRIKSDYRGGHSGYEDENGNFDRYSYKLQKSLMTLTNNVYLGYMYYLKWSPDGPFN